MKLSTYIIAALVILFGLHFIAQSGSVGRSPGQRTSVAGTPDKSLGGVLGR